jgi:hypothetical protein
MQIREILHRITTTRYVRTLEAELSLERAVVTRLGAVIAQQGAEISQQGIEVGKQDAEIARLRAENRALLNSILGIAGIPPLPATEADLAAVQSSLYSGTGPAGRRDRENDACAPLLSQNPSDLGLRTESHAMNSRGQVEACPTEDSSDAPASDSRTAGVSPAPLPLGLQKTKMLEQQQNPNSKTPARRRRYEDHSTNPARSTTPHVAAPTRRRSWPQIHRLLEFESAQKEKPATDSLPPACSGKRAQ